jgi:hypothetical protein
MNTPALPSATPSVPDAFQTLPGIVVDRHREAWAFTPVTHARRHAIEKFIRDGFHKAYGARIDVCHPTLMALYRDRELVAACGLSRAAAYPLFLEAYLDAPVEQVLSGVLRTPVAREAIVEVGNLTVARVGFARQLIVHLTEYLHEYGPAWVVFSAVPQLRNNFVRLGIPLIRLAQADPDRLPSATREAWGTYYESYPQVTAVKVAAARSALLDHRCIP